MKRSRGTAGFTLAELLIVVSIIGILVAVAIPVFSAAMSRVEEGACQANRASLLRQLVVEQMTDEPMTKEEFQKRVKEIGITCPTKGTYTAAQGAGVAVSVTCDKHGKSEGGEGGGDTGLNRTPQKVGVALATFVERYMASVPNPHSINTNARKLMFQELGGWPELTVTTEKKSTTAYIQPYLYATEGNYTVFASDRNSGEDGWNASYIYHPGEKTWYSKQPNTGYEHKTITVANKTWEQLEEEMKLVGWGPVGNYGSYEEEAFDMPK